MPHQARQRLKLNPKLLLKPDFCQGRKTGLRMKTQRNQQGEQMNPRSCIVTREKAERGDLIRFALSPEGKVVPDLKGNLPGRGVWTKTSKAIVEEAEAKGHFSRAFKQKVETDGKLAELTGRLIGERALQALAMAKKAGILVTGFAKVNSAVRSGKVSLLLHAKDCAADGKRKLASAVSLVGHLDGEPVAVREIWTTEEMSKALGIENAVHVAAIHGGAANNLMAAIERMNAYMGNSLEETV